MSRSLSTSEKSINPMYGTISNIELPRPITNFSPRHPRRRCKALTRWIYGLFVFLSLLLVAWWSFGIKLGTTLLSRVSPPPYIAPRKNWDGLRNQSWAVGFDLSAGYGTASIAFNNGTIVNIARWTDARGEEYNAVLAKLSLESSAHPTPPYYNGTAQWHDLGRQWKRWWNKMRKMPASDDVLGLFSAMLRLKTDGNAWLRRHGMDEMQVVFVTVPLLPALYNEDLVDAADFAGLQILTLPWYIHRSGDQAQWPVSEINTAFAGMGLGLGSIFPGKNETEGEPWSENILSVSFTEQALTAHISPIISAPHFYAAGGMAKFSLGLAAKENMGDDVYWEEVRGALREALGSYLSRGNMLGRVIVHGEAAKNEVFERVLREEVGSAQLNHEEGKRPRWYVGDEWTAGRGAAVFGNWCQRGLERGDVSGCFPDLRPRGPGW